MLDPDFAKHLAERFETPLYAYDLDAVDARATELLRLVPAAGRLLYSLKANPLPSIVETLMAHGIGAEVSSDGELDVALASGVAPERILVTGPGKSRSLVERALSAKVPWFSLESDADRRRLQALAEAHATRPRCLLRIRPAEPTGAGLSMAGPGSQFGLTAEGWPKALAENNELSFDLAGFHVYAGTQIGSVAALQRAFDEARRTAQQLAESLHLTPEVVDLGGGFPWPYATEGEGLDLADLSIPAAPPAAIWLESGRRLVASSGVLVARVLDAKSDLGPPVVVLDAGIHVLGGMSGLGRVLRPQTTFLGPSPETAAAVVGPLCSPLDRLANETQAPCAIGALVRVPNVGAYGLTASLIAFLSHRPPIEIVHRGTQIIAAHRLRWGHGPVPC